jgi:hypothetical protein
MRRDLSQEKFGKLLSLLRRTHTAKGCGSVVHRKLLVPSAQARSGPRAVLSLIAVTSHTCLVFNVLFLASDSNLT